MNDLLTPFVQDFQEEAEATNDLPPFQILNEDAAAVVGNLGYFDYIITDPPYAIGGKSSMQKGSSVLQAREMVNRITESFITQVIRSVKKKNEFAIWLMCDWRQVSALAKILEAEGLPRQSCVVWNKMRGAFSGQYHPSHELVVYASNAKMAGGFWGKDVMDIPRPLKKYHAFDKPPELTQALCRNFRPGRVLDPFCGAGGLLVGARRLGWEVVGVEIDDEAAAIARERLANTRRVSHG